jgi:hypothetical protein
LNPWESYNEQSGGDVITKRAARWSKLALLSSGVLALAGATITPGYAATDIEVYLLNALPGNASTPRLLDVAIDGKTVAEKATTGAVLPPVKGKPGSKVTFTENGTTIGVTTIKTKAPSKAFVVEHLRATQEDDPVAEEFTVKKVNVPSGKAWLEFSNVAATSLPLDFRVRDRPRDPYVVLFENVANGKTSSSGVQLTAGTYKVSLVPTTQTKPVLCCTDDLTVEGGKMTIVFAFGNQATNTINIAVAQLDAGTTGSERPTEVNTGTGGQAINDGPSFEVDLVR